MNDTNDTQLDQLEPGEETEALQSGEDLALTALNTSEKKAQVKSKKADNVDDEVKASNDLADALQALQNLIERNANELERVKQVLKEKRESLKSVFENDASFQEATVEAETLMQQVKERKSQINNSPQAMALKTTIGELNQEKKEIETTLSNHLVNYYGITNSKSFDTTTGDQWEFDIVAKVKSKPKSEE